MKYKIKRFSKITTRNLQEFRQLKNNVISGNLNKNPLLSKSSEKISNSLSRKFNDSKIIQNKLKQNGTGNIIESYHKLPGNKKLKHKNINSQLYFDFWNDPRYINDKTTINKLPVKNPKIRSNYYKRIKNNNGLLESKKIHKTDGTTRSGGQQYLFDF